LTISLAQTWPPQGGMHKITRLVIALAILPFALVMFANLPDQLLLFPTTKPLNPRGAARKTLPFDHGELEVWIAQSKRARLNGTPETYVVRFYGNADRADAWVAAEAEMWNERAIEIWGMNYPGFGGSTGPARLSRIGPAALAAFDELQHRARDRPIVVYGASLGATAALHVAASRPAGIAGLILHNPPPLREMILRQFGWWNLWLLAGPVALQIPRDLDSIQNARAIRAPAIFLLAERDEVVAPRFHRLVVNAYSGEKRVIALHGAYHNDPIEGVALANLNDALGWLLGKISLPHAQ